MLPVGDGRHRVGHLNVTVVSPTVLDRTWRIAQQRRTVTLMKLNRLRQVVVTAHDRDATAKQIVDAFALGEPFHDPGVGEFGLHNCVYPVGDAFLEIVSPVRENTTAGRYMERHGGDAGYMVIFQVADIEKARDHLRAERCRTVWTGDYPAISGTHLHPADIGGAIVSVDQPRPPESWMWAGPKWQDNMATSVAKGVAGVTIADDDPVARAATWSRLLNQPLVDGEMRLDDGSVVRFVDSGSVGGRSGLVGIDLRATSPADAGRRVTIAGTDFRLVT